MVRQISDLTTDSHVAVPTTGHTKLLLPGVWHPLSRVREPAWNDGVWGSLPGLGGDASSHACLSFPQTQWDKRPAWDRGIRALEPCRYRALRSASARRFPQGLIHRWGVRLSPSTPLRVLRAPHCLPSPLCKLCAL